MILKHLEKNNFHHAYLIEGKREEIMPDIFSFMKVLGISTTGNPDFSQIQIDNFKIDEALNLRSMAEEKSFTTSRKVFVISANHFSLDAEHSLLKMFEEPIENTHFFLIVPDRNALLKTLVSRFYFIQNDSMAGDEFEVEKFIAMFLRDRINFIKELLIEVEDEEGNDLIATDSIRSKALRFLNELETILHKRLVSKRLFDTSLFEHFFKVREFLRMPGSSTKSLMESVALVIPEKI